MHPFLLFSTIILTFLSAEMAGAQSDDHGTLVIAVDSPAFVFSPDNWTGDQGRGGSVFRQSWYPGAYFRVTWTTTNATPSADLLLDTNTLANLQNKPQITYNVDGVRTDAVSWTNEIKVNGLKDADTHTLTVYFKTSDHSDRWASTHESGKNVFLMDLGKPVANALAANGYWSGLHPNLRGHAVFAAKILSRMSFP